ncbi:MAG: rubrerythrin family protein [Clostridia bacterium]|nr:rubrerythrin family protein [Clostridia bacterium]
MIEFKNSETSKNLMRAFAGESQARNRYTIAAGIACQQKLPVIEQIFKFTADQEKEHATIFYNHLKELNGEVINIDGSYPVNNSTSILELLRSAEHNEFEEYDSVYKSFAKTAKEEGFGQVAASFEMIAAIEKVHGERFKEFAELMEKDMLFASTEVESWMCLNCGHIHTGAKVPLFCPVCQHEQGYFIRLTKAPYTG